jgi:hypothetical protein
MCSDGPGEGFELIAMDVINDDAKGGFRRIEVLTVNSQLPKWYATAWPPWHRMRHGRTPSEMTVAVIVRHDFAGGHSGSSLVGMVKSRAAPSPRSAPRL